MQLSSGGVLSLIAAVLTVSLPAAAFGRGECGFQPAFSQPDERGTTSVMVFRGDPVPGLGNARPLLFITSLKVNTDGTRISYHQDDPTGNNCQNNPGASPCAINNIRNSYRNHTRPESDFTNIRDAGYPPETTWQVLSPSIIEKNSTTGKPCITPDGYLVSMTADVAVPGGFARQGDCDPSKWIDALTVPAIVLPTAAKFLNFGLKKRSLVVAVSRSATKRVVPGLVGDFGPPNELGEATVAMNRALNGIPDTEQPKHYQDAKNRFQAGRTAVLLFPGNEFIVARPVTGGRVDNAGGAALSKFGGAEKLYRCIRDEVDTSF